MTCDCPACTPPCQRIGHKCFVPCDECIEAVEYDAVGAITSKTVTMAQRPILSGWYVIGRASKAEVDASLGFTPRTVTVGKLCFHGPEVSCDNCRGRGFDNPPSIYSEGFWRALHEAGWLKEGEA